MTLNFCETVNLVTDDGCAISLVHYRAHRTPGRQPLTPVLLLHGFGSRAEIWQSPVQSINLGSYLSLLGHPVYLLNLRHREGGGLRRSWDLEDYLHHDIPTSLQWIREHANQPGVHWIGHSMGGMLGYMYQILNPMHGIRSLTTLGSPGLKGRTGEGQLLQAARTLTRIAPVLRTCRIDLIPLSLISGALTMSNIVVSPSALTNSVRDFVSYRRQPIFGNFSGNETRQLTSLMSPEGLRSSRYEFNYSDRTHHIRTPLLGIAGDRDFLAPPALVRRGIDEAGSSRRNFIEAGPASGAPRSYGHLDLVMGRDAVHDIFPLIGNWIAEHEGQALPAPPQREAPMVSPTGTFAGFSGGTPAP